MIVLSMFMPHGMCFQWQPDILTLHVLSDALIAIAYFSIPVLLVHLIQARSDLPFRIAFRMFSAFIVACGLTHVLSIVVIWDPIYWIEGWLKAATAVLSILTVITLAILLPRILATRSPAALERANIELEAAAEKLLTDATTDALTTLPNRRGFELRAPEALANCRRAATQASLMMIDIDDFKAFNDAYGHPAGDMCLRMTAVAIKTALHRPRDYVARFGGEELVIILEDTDAESSQLIGERVRTSVAALQMKQGAGARHAVVTVSVGIATVRVVEDTTPEVLLGLADHALYQAKAQGRNCVLAWGLVPTSASQTEARGV